MAKRSFFIPPDGADVIRKKIKALGYSQDVFAEELIGVNGRTLRNWLSGKTKITEHNLEQMLMEIGVGVFDIFGDDVPSSYREKSTLSNLVGTFRSLVVSGDVRKAFQKYRSYLQALSEHVTFHRIPVRGSFFTYDHDETHCHHYAHVEITMEEEIDEAVFALSWQFLRLVRVTIGEIVVTKETITTKPFFQKYPHEVRRDQTDLCKAGFAFWLAQDGALFFVESRDNTPFKAHVKAYLTEQEHKNSDNEIAVFWKGVWF